MTFKDQSWDTRFKTLGDPAEKAFEKWCEQIRKINYIRWGLNRPPLRMSAIPTRLRYSPDYLTSNNFYEVQGIGKDQIIKLKIEKHGALRYWDSLHPVKLWIHNAVTSEQIELSLDDYDTTLTYGVTEIKTFPEGKAYFASPWEALKMQASKG